MDEVIALETEIRNLIGLARIKMQTAPASQRFDVTFLFEGEGVLAGKASMLSGSRLERLRQIAVELRKF